MRPNWMPRYNTIFCFIFKCFAVEIKTDDVYMYINNILRENKVKYAFYLMGYGKYLGPGYWVASYGKTAKLGGTFKQKTVSIFFR